VKKHKKNTKKNKKSDTRSDGALFERLSELLRFF